MASRKRVIGKKTAGASVFEIPIENHAHCITLDPRHPIWLDFDGTVPSFFEACAGDFVRVQPNAKVTDAELARVVDYLRNAGAHVKLQPRPVEARADTPKAEVAPSRGAREVVEEMIDAWKGGDVGALAVECEDIMVTVGL